MESLRICAECKWCAHDAPMPREVTCRHPNAERFRDVVSGAWPLCKDMRKVSDPLRHAAIAGYPDYEGMEAERSVKCFGEWYEPVSVDVRSQEND